MKVKICGLTRREDAAAAIAAGADLLGFIFVPGTPRAVSAASAPWIRDLQAATVGVFRDAPLAAILEARERLGLDWIQLHGDESDSLLDELGPRVIRRVKPAATIDWARVAWLGERFLPLLDPGAGDGIACEWQSLGRRPAGIAFGLAGGLTPENVAEAVRIVRPTLVDVASGIESAPGIKDHELLNAFVKQARL